MVRQVGPFNACFDARRLLRPYRVMERWSPHNIDPSDVIVMEVRIDRWKCDSVGNVLREGSWTHYRAGLELLAVSLLLKSSLPIPLEVLTETDIDEYTF